MSPQYFMYHSVELLIAQNLYVILYYSFYMMLQNNFIHFLDDYITLHMLILESILKLSDCFLLPKQLIISKYDMLPQLMYFEKLDNLKFSSFNQQ